MIKDIIENQNNKDLHEWNFNLNKSQIPDKWIQKQKNALIVQK